jgi:glycopeptide antibiotics resistance protein
MKKRFTIAAKRPFALVLTRLPELDTVGSQRMAIMRVLCWASMSCQTIVSAIDAMRPSTREQRQLPGRRTYAVATLIYALFVIYGSLVPLEFQPLALDEALDRFSEIFVFPLLVDSRTDVFTNVVLFIPLGYCWLAALRTDRGATGRLAAAMLVIVCCVALSVTIEFTQIFFHGRTEALSDILAECSGGIVGVALWLSSGEIATALVRNCSVERERPALMQRLLLVYCVGLFVSQMLPLDLTLGLGELAQKYRGGRIILVPFGYSHSSRLAAAWDYLTDVALTAPLGAAAALLWTPTGTRRSPWVAFAAGTLAVSFIEFAQLFVFSRFSDVTDLMTGSVGVALGVAAVPALSDRSAATMLRKEPARGAFALARIALAVWIGVLLSYHWQPFDFTVEPRRVVAGVHELLSLPFSSYYAATTWHAVMELSRKSLLALPLGMLLRLSWPHSDHRRSPISQARLVLLAGLGFCLLLAVEVGQIFLPSRVPDMTDAILGELGVVAGLWLIGPFVSPPQDRARAHNSHVYVSAPGAGPRKRLSLVRSEPGSPKAPQRTPLKPSR